MRWMLLIDTCGTQGGVGLADLGRVPPGGSAAAALVAQRTLPGRETQEQLLSAIREVLAAAALAPADLDVFAVVTGPGSFTGVRIGLAAVKGLAEALGKPVIAISRLAVLAAQARTSTPVQAWIDAGRGDVFVGTYREGTERERMMHGGDAVHGLGPDETLIVMDDRLQQAYPAARRVPEVGVAEALPLALAALAAGRFADIALLDANYLRVPDAELARQARELAATPPAANSAKISAEATNRTP